MNILETIKQRYANFELLEKYVTLIENKNKVMNLTGFTGNLLWEEGIYQSLICLEEIKGKTLLDIGAGAGFPSVPHAIAFPETQVTIYEPLQKRVLFLQEVIQTLKLANIKLEIMRAENSKEQEKYDFVTARAVAPLKVLIEIAHRPLKIGGQMIFLKGPNLKQEISDAQDLLKKLNLKWTITTKKINAKEINLIKLIKIKKTPAIYPRSWIQIKKGIK